MVLFLIKKFIIQFLYFLKIHHCSFKVSLMYIFKAFWGYSFSIVLFSISIISFSQAFSTLSIFFTISSSALSSELCSLVANCSSIHYEISCSVTAEILSNNFPCISTFLCVRLKIIAMAYIRVISNTIELLFEYLALFYQYHSVISSHKSFLLFCLLFVLVSV